MKSTSIPIVFFLLAAFFTGDGFSQPQVKQIPVYTYKIIQVYPHDQTAFTQGLVYEDGFFYEGTGGHGRSSIRKIDVKRGTVIQYLPIPGDFFGEGITILDNRIIQLTWREYTGFVYDRDSFIKLEEFYYPTEGWGLTHDSSRLIQSDGTATIRFLDPYTFETVGQIEVTDEKGAVPMLNELEYINGEIYANVWPSDRIAVIDPATGKVNKYIELSGLRLQQPTLGSDNVLNGIAWDKENRRLYVTGKLWAYIYQIELILK